jgi:hypothetical protein
MNVLMITIIIIISLIYSLLSAICIIENNKLIIELRNKIKN